MDGDYGDALRRQAAVFAELVAEYREDEQTFHDLVETERRVLPKFGLAPGALEHLAEESKKQRDGLELLQQVTAAQAIAYDEMMAAGGLDNHEEYAEYRRTTERLAALMPQFGDRPDGHKPRS